MSRSRITAVFALLSLAGLATAQTDADAATVSAPGRVDAVTLYRGQALVTRSVPLPARTGTLEIVVPDMPHAVLGDSMYAESDDSAEIRAVRYRTRAVGEAPRGDIRTLERELAAAQAALNANAAGQKLVQARLASLDRLDGFVAPTAHADLAKGALDADALERLVLFGFEQRRLANEELLKLGAEATELAGRIELLGRRRAELAASSSRTVREAVVFVEKRRAGPGALRLSYLVTGCGWSPAYNIRADRGREVVQVEYNALIQQTTGEDWNGVRLTLSTATPGLSAEGPGLAPFTVTLSGQPAPGAPQTEAAQRFKKIARAQSDARYRQMQAVSAEGNFDTAWEINVAANDLQCLELLTGKSTLESVLREQQTSRAEGPSLSYGLDGPVSLASRADQQMVRITRSELAADFRYVALPVLTAQVYREAELVNTSGRDLLAGPVSAYLDGRFVGRAEIGTVAKGQSFVVGLGADPGLLVHRELADKSERVQGGNKILDLKVRLRLENFHERAIPVRLYDRLPHLERGDDEKLRVAMGDTSDALSEDADYVAGERPKGILRWDIEVAASAGGKDARVVEYAYSLEYDRQLALATPGGQQTAPFKEDFLELEKARGRR